MSTDQALQPARARAREFDDSGRSRLLVFGIVSIALLMASVDQTIVATALPSIQRDLHAQVNWSAWTITVYSLGQVMVMPLAGKIGDLIGRKRLFLGSVVVFTLASLACGLAGNIYLLIVLRALQSFGGGCFMPCATGIIAGLFRSGRDRALGMFSSIFSLGAVIGPVLGGVLVTYWSWRGIFFVNIPVGVLLLVLGTLFIPSIAPRPESNLDVRGVVLLGVTLLSAMLGVGYLGGDHSSPLSAWFIGPEVLAVVAGRAFFRHTGRAASPFISLRFLTGRGFGSMNLLNFLYGIAVVGFAPLVPLYAQDRFHMLPLAAGTLVTARAVGMIVTTAVAVYLLRRTGYRWPIAIGFVLSAVGFFAAAQSPHAGLTPYAWLAASTCLCGVAAGFATPASNNATMQLAPEHAASIAGLRGMFRQAGSITAISVTSAVIARSADPGLAQAHLFVVFGALLVLSLPLVLLVPEYRGRW